MSRRGFSSAMRVAAAGTCTVSSCGWKGVILSRQGNYLKDMQDKKIKVVQFESVVIKDWNGNQERILTVLDDKGRLWERRDDLIHVADDWYPVEEMPED